eukprot:CAMPEP_0171514664 /NCGR_PEP_ID=MMETSP0959-20130129/2980_1 /TAXON_ID=87120 /ORGANISM="Aurantiochytrium limacinum, Strain ATCCMYA-1381" /LENGTH=43 /DNA_ID= /DNA_START= /DNA_END= /DNA_ORIENTATION=
MSTGKKTKDHEQEDFVGKLKKDHNLDNNEHEHALKLSGAEVLR